MVILLCNLSVLIMFLTLPGGQGGWLPYWQLIGAVMGIFNAIQNFTTLKLTRRVYNNVPATTGLPIFAFFFFLSLKIDVVSYTSPSKNFCCLEFDFRCSSHLCSLRYSRQTVSFFFFSFFLFFFTRY